MAVALRAGASMVWQPSPGYRTVPIPTTPAVPQPGDLAVIRASFESNDKLGPRGTDWTATGWDVWTKRLTADDIAMGSVVVDGRLTGMTVVQGCRGTGRQSMSNGVRLTEAGAGMYTFGWTPKWSGDPLGYPTTGMLGDDIELTGSRQWVAHWFLAHTTTGSKYLPEDDDAEGYRTFELLPSKSPNPPILSAPSGGVNLDVAVSFFLQWIHQSNGGLVQEGYQARLRLVGSPTWQYVLSNGSLTATATTIPSSTAASLVGSGLAAGTYEWSAATMDGGVLGAFSTPETFVLVAKPTVAPTLVTAHGDMTPTGSWTRTTPGGTQTASRSVIAPTGAGVSSAIWGSGTLLGAGSNIAVTSEGWVGTPWSWVNSGSYELWTQIQQTGGLWSDFTASAPKVVSWTNPPAPGSITPVDGSPFSLLVTGVSATSSKLEIQHKIDGVWAPLTTVIGPSASNSIPVPGAPYGIPREYRARSWEIVDGVAVYSAWTVSVAASSTDMASYFIGSDGVDWVRVSVLSEGDITVLQGIDVSQPMTGPDTDPNDVVPMVERTKVGGVKSQIKLQAFLWQDLEALKEWVSTRTSWDYRRTPERGADGLLRDAPSVRMGQAGKISYAKRVQTNTSIREMTFEYVKQK